MVGLIAEEHADDVGRRHEPVGVGVLGALLCEPRQGLLVGGVVGVFYDHLLAHDAALAAKTQQAHHPFGVGVEVEHGRVVVGLVGEEHGGGHEHGGGQALAEPDGPHASAGHAVAHVVEDVEDDEHDYGDDDGQSESALPDDGAQRGTDEEEEEARQGEHEFVERLYLVLTYQFVAVAGEHAFEVELHNLLAHLARRHVHRALLLVVGEAGVEGVEGHFFRPGYAQRVVSRHLGLGQGVELGLLEVVVSDAVVVVVQ